ncbi:MAG: NUDIX domain-containing protein [Candidatus Pacebacteria bacterium]|nr:NUDIX domain-containing protein [Candidatus Paceibacterota bacterium]
MQRAPEHLRFAVLAVDVALFTIRDRMLYVRVMQVNRPPHFQNMLGLPGGLIQEDETAEEAAARVLKERGGIDSEKAHMEQLFTFSDVNRDPRGRVVAVAYLALVPWDTLSTLEQADTPSAQWQPVAHTARLAYDHTEVLETAIERLRSRISYSTLISKLLPNEFTLSELQIAYESVRGELLDKRNFRKKIDMLNVLTPLKKKRTGVRARPALLYRFSSSVVKITPQL